MELRHLKYFQAVAEELSFSKAARRLHVAQPALSRAVQELEAELGARLFNRTRRVVTLTSAGTVLLHETGFLLQRVEESVRRVKRTAAGEEGELRLGYIGPPTQRFLGRILREYRSRYPRVTVALEERTPERVWEMVARGRLDIGLTRPVLAHHALGLSTLALREEPLLAVLSQGHKLAQKASARWSDLEDEPLVILSRREGVGLHDAILDACRRSGFSPRLAHTPSVIGTVLSHVEAGEGIGVIPDSVAVLGAGRPLEFRPLKPTSAVELVMVWSKESDSPPAQSFRQLVQEWIAKDMLWP